MYSDDMPYGDYLVEWLKLKGYSYSPQTLHGTEFYIRSRIVPRLGHLPLSQLSPIVLQEFVNALKDEGLSNGTVRQVFTIIHSSLDTAEKLELVSRNNASAVILPKIKRKQLQVWDIEQVKQFLKLASKDPYTYIAFHLALLTGMRQGEILGLRWVDVNLSEGVLFVRQILTQDGKEFLPGAKTSSGVRSIALDPDTVIVLEKHRSRVQEDKSKSSGNYQDNGLVVCSSLGKRIHSRSLVYVWHRLLDESGLSRITFHDLRHTHASLLLKNNVHPKIVSERLGHASIQITLDTYSHLLPNMQMDAAQKLGEDIFVDPLDDE